MEHPRHLLTVWNPSYATDALDAHLSVLLDWSRRAEAGQADPDEDVYVWWGKLWSVNRDGMLPHHKEVVALDEQIQSGVETHLYLTDYRSLYVAHLGEITDDDVRDEDERDHMPAYYKDRPADFWFRIWDLRRIVTDDTPAIIAELKYLRNTRYFDRPVSLYGGMVELPLIVSRTPDQAWFSDRDALTDGRLWTERAAELRSDVAGMSRELRDNLFGRDVWAAMEPTTRAFLASAESVFRARRDDPGFDLSGAAVEYGKAVEVELNALLFPAVRRAMKSKSLQEREVRVEGCTIDLGGQVPHQTLGALIFLLDKNVDFGRAVRTIAQHDASWLCGVVPKRLSSLRELRNAAAHSDRVGIEELIQIREQLLGIGTSGLLSELVRARLRL